jgi:hypothetical protein
MKRYSTAGGAAFVLTANGSNFSTNASLHWNGTAQSTTRAGANQLTATIAARDNATPATVPVTATNPAVAGMGIRERRHHGSDFQSDELHRQPDRRTV